VLTRADLSPGQQATQSTHAALKFSIEHPLLCETWYRESSYLVLLQVPDEDGLFYFHKRACQLELVHSVWTEPDMDDTHTAIAIAPSELASRLLANLPLLLREPVMT
jgi:peptidyl-tRNA hydrolase